MLIIDSTHEGRSRSKGKPSTETSSLVRSINSALCTFLKAFLCASNDQNILLFYDHQDQLTEKQYDHNEGFHEEISPATPSSIPLTNRFAQMILRMSKVARQNGCNLKKRILFVQVGSDGVDLTLGTQCPKLISLAYHCKNAEIVCDFIAATSTGNSCGVLRQVAEIAGGIQVPVVEVVDSKEEKIFLAVLFAFVGLDSGVGRRLMPVNSEVGSSKADGAACNCHGQSISIGYLCPVCLGIYCESVEQCSFCACHFE